MPPQHDHEPRWNIIDKLYHKIDKSLDKAFVDNKCSFLEVEITMLMVQEKLSQQKHELYSMYLEQKESDTKKEDTDEEKKGKPKDIYQ